MSFTHGLAPIRPYLDHRVFCWLCVGHWTPCCHFTLASCTRESTTDPEKHKGEDRQRSRNERRCGAKKAGRKDRDRIGTWSTLDIMVLLSPSPDVPSPGMYPLQPSSKIPISDSAHANVSSNQSLDHPSPLHNCKPPPPPTL